MVGLKRGTVSAFPLFTHYGRGFISSFHVDSLHVPFLIKEKGKKQKTKQFPVWLTFCRLLLQPFTKSTTCCVTVTRRLSSSIMLLLHVLRLLTSFRFSFQLDLGEEVEVEEFYVKFKGLWVTRCRSYSSPPPFVFPVRLAPFFFFGLLVHKHTSSMKLQYKKLNLLNQPQGDSFFCVVDLFWCEEQGNNNSPVTSCCVVLWFSIQAACSWTRRQMISKPHVGNINLTSWFATKCWLTRSSEFKLGHLTSQVCRLFLNNSDFRMIISSFTDLTL